MTLHLHGIGTALPKVAATQLRARELASEISCSDERERTLLRALYRKSGIDTRHSVILEQGADGCVEQTFLQKPTSSEDRGPTTRQRMQRYARESVPLARSACQEALARAQCEANEIDQLVTVSCSGFFAPGIDSLLIGELGLRPTVQRTHVGFMGCHGALNGLRVANGLAALPDTRRVLICAVELCSLHFQYGFDPQHMVANSIFADGAAALVGGTDRQPWSLQASGSCVLPDSRDAMHWEIDDHGFSMGLSAAVPSLIENSLRPWIESWLDHNGLSVGDVASWAVHPGGVRILSAVEASLELPADALTESRAVLSEHGNMSSPTILFILERLVRARAPRPCVALGFGPGLVVEAALFR
ncbi:MAG: type III polyketide synthase [Planctomycetota bacterium]